MDPRVVFLEAIGHLVTEIIRTQYGETALSPCRLFGDGCGDEIKTLN